MRKTQKESFEVALKHYLDDKSINSHNKQLLQTFFRDADLDKFDRSIDYRRRNKYITFFKFLEQWFNHKPLEEISEKELEEWYLDLKHDKIKLNDQKNYSTNTKSTYIILVKFVWKWLKGDNEVYPTEVKHFKPNWESKPIKDIKKKDIEKLAHHFKSFKYTFTTLFLFDSGFRKEEFFSMKLRNLQVATRDNGEDYYLAECEQSKTKPRKVGVALYPGVYNQYVKEYCSHKQSDDLLVDFTYEGYRKALNEASKDVLGMRITPHDLRKASATYFAGILANPYKVNKKYGWTMTSNVGNVYIDAAGIPEEESVELVEQNQISDIKKRLEAQEKANKELQHQIKLLVVERLKKRA